MSFLAQLDSFLARAFQPGRAAVDPSTHVFGVDPETFAPQEYVDYLATSNNVYVCATLRAELLASLPLRLYRVAANGDRKDVTSGALWELTQKVNPFWTFSRLIEMTELSLCTWGSAFWALERGNGSTPREIWWMRSDRVRVVPHPQTYVAGYRYRPVAGGEDIVFAPDEMIWIRRPNPIDEYSGLSPLAAARIAADISSAAAKSNRNLYTNGISLGGLVTPVGEDSFSEEHAKGLVDMLKHQARGASNAHRWIVLRQDAKFTQMGMSPKDAEYLGSMKWNLEEIARAYKVPLDLVGGQRTYENVDAAMKAIWTNCLLPEARLISTELTEQLLPLFAGSERVDLCEFDPSGIKVLQDDEQIAWQIAQGQLREGVLLPNEYRQAKGKTPVKWGDVWWGSLALVPIDSAELPEPEVDENVDGTGNGSELGANQDEADRSRQRTRPALSGVERDGGSAHLPRASARSCIRVAFDSDEHQRLWRAFVQRTERHEAKVARTARTLFRQQEQSILTELGKAGRSAWDVSATWEATAWTSRTEPGRVVAHGVFRAAEPEELLAKIFSIAKWRKRFRETMRPVLGQIVADGGQTALDAVAVGVSFDVTDPNVARFLERRAQRFAVEVNDTTWKALKATLTEGLAAGEGIDVLKERVSAVMADRIRSSAEVIARTEVIGAYNGGTLEGWRQSGVVQGKEWLAALDDRTRETHVEAHGQIVALDADFRVGDGQGPAPGQIGVADEDIQCRCSMLAVLAPLA